jgi:L-amino acid N-acyltransferase YncA
MISIRQATLSDISSITDIYNEAILQTAATFDTEPKDVTDRIKWFGDRDENFPIMVAEYKEKIAGYAALNKWSERKAYDITAEISVYVHSFYRGNGIGKALVRSIVAIGEETKLKTLIARITEGNDHSIYLHEQVGFKMVGTLRQVGQKFGKLLDVTIMQKVYQ